MKRSSVTLVLLPLIFAAAVAGQGGRPASPPASAATETGGTFKNGPDGQVYQGGKWIEISYSGPIRRGRDLWGSGASYGRNLNSGAPVWRAGANVTTRLKTELPLVVAGKTVAPGEYSLFIDLKPNNWTLIVSNWAAQRDFDPNNRSALWGSFGYTPDKDLLRAPMKLEAMPHSFDQLSWQFLDVNDSGGAIALLWDKTLASVGYRVGS